ncbi:MAG: hypothetical protein HYS17_01305 [Micavibrio aeruginosavorus]|uniref:Uncharacterized protein n=1 Tax=Micavibrio aeruginosavorus TaxID=349221 RepID=A0A7T5R2P1_9BACT|nr:MAG: hypothetical protein HYS17_01305 [Micavibrio aeruginosavorus]
MQKEEGKMAAEPTLGVITKVKLGAFATEMGVKYPEQRGAILSLQDTLEQRLPPSIQNQITERLNRDADGTLAKARSIIEKDPKILDAINKDPMKLAQIMGVTAPQAPAVAASAEPPRKIEGASGANAPARPEQQPQGGSAPAAVAAAPPAKPLSQAEMSDRQALNEAAMRISKMTGFEEFAAKAQKSQSLEQAMDAMMGDKKLSAADRLKSLKEIESDPEFFVKANKAIEDIPPQMRDNVFSQIAENPALGRQALSGDGGAKMQLMMGGMFGGGGKGFSNLFGGEGGGLGEMLSKILPKLLEGLQQALAPIMQGIGKMMNSSGLMGGMGNGQGQVMNNFARTIDQTMGSDIRNKPYVDANRPEQPAMTLAQRAAEVPAPDARAEPATAPAESRRLPGVQNQTGL